MARSYRLRTRRQSSLIHRNNAYLIPTGKTRVEPGDTLLVLGDRERLATVRERLEQRDYE